MSLLFVTILKNIGGKRGGPGRYRCQADVMKKSNHFIVMINYYAFIIVTKCVPNVSSKLKNSKVYDFEV